jgi:two-component system, OmpR family, phosphate regulon sensor histidine kinase PhoR
MGQSAHLSKRDAALYDRISPVDAETQAVLFNAVPLLVLAALHGAAGVAVARSAPAPALRRPALRRLRERRVATALLFPCTGVAAAILGLATLFDQQPVAGHLWLSLVAIVVAALPAALALSSRVEPAAPNGRPGEAFSGNADSGELGSLLADQVIERFGVDLAKLVIAAGNGRFADVVAARERGRDVEWLRGMRLDLEAETTGVGTVLRNPVPFAVFDAQASSGISKRLAERAHAKSCAFVPVIVGSRTIGALAVAMRTPRAFTQDELSQIQALAAEAGLALTRASADSTAQARLERGFYRIAAVLSEPLSAEATLDAVAQAASESLGGDSAAVLRVAGGALDLAGAYELPESLRAFLASTGVDDLATAARAGKLLASRDLRGDNRFGPRLVEAATRAGCSSLLAVPLTQPRTDSGGLILVFFDQEHAFTDEQLELAGHVAGAARGALERSELYELERRSRALAQHLASSGRELAGELDPENVLERLARLALSLLSGSAASVWVLERDELVVHAACGEGASDALELRIPSTAWLLGDIVQSRSARTISNAQGDARASETDPMIAAGHVASIGVPLIGPDGGVRGVLCVYDGRPREWREEEAEALLALAGAAAAARDNAEQYQSVWHEQQRSEAILENVADGIVAVDRDGRVVLWNPAAEHITGVPGAEALGRTPLQVLGRSLESDEDALEGVSRLVSIRRGADEAWLSLSEAVMTDPAGAVAGRIFAFRDISGERAVEQMKSDFVSTVSHELRTPLTSIYGFAETLLRQDVLFGDAERETFLRYIASESERLTSIVDRLLSVAQLDTGAMSVQIAETDVSAVVSEVVHALELSLGDNGHRFVVSLPDEHLAAEADRDKLGQVLSHLLDNAVRYSPAGGTVTVGARRAERAVEVRVADEGVGIPRAEQERIFRKFYRGESSARTVGAGAAGLGLFLAEGLVTAMGGRIWVDSDEGRGATFVIELPAAGD